jgi:intein-encoded DNA endonuclease-like protein
MIENLAMQPSEKLAYIIGVVLGDGTISRKDNRIRLGVTDKAFAISFYNTLKDIGLNPTIWKDNKQKINWSDVWRVSVYNKNLHEFLKNLTIEKIKEIIDRQENAIAFLKGFYESEGILLSTRFHIFVVNTNVELINLVFTIFDRLNLRARIYGPYGPYPARTKQQKRSFYRIALHYKEDVNKFLKLVNPCIKNKPMNKI